MKIQWGGIILLFATLVACGQTNLSERSWPSLTATLTPEQLAEREAEVEQLAASTNQAFLKWRLDSQGGSDSGKLDNLADASAVRTLFRKWLTSQPAVTMAGDSRQTGGAQGSRTAPPPARWVAKGRNLFVAENTAFKASVASELNTEGVLEVVTTTGEQLRSTVLGLVYWEPGEGGRRVVVATLKASTAVLLSEDRLVFPDAFEGDGVTADVVLQITPYSLAQDVAIRGRLQSPAYYGLAEESHLSVVTEFYDPPPPRRSQAVSDDPDETLQWGFMRLIRGKAFSLGENSDPGEDVQKNWIRDENGYQLWESVSFDRVQDRVEGLPQLKALPASGPPQTPPRRIPGQSSLRPMSAPEAMLVGAGDLFRPFWIEESPALDNLVAMDPVASLAGPAFVLDYTLSSGQNLINVDFASGSKQGFAAVGITPSDVWNDCPPGGTVLLTNLLWANATGSGVSLTMNNGPGAWGFSPGGIDGMYDSYLYSYSSGTITVTINGLPEGSYDLYLYGHGSTAPGNSGFSLTAPVARGPLITTSTGTQYATATWAEGQQYIVFRNVAVAGGQAVTFTVGSAASPGFNFLNGMQLVQNPLQPSCQSWVEDQIPLEGIPVVNSDTWTWVSSNPSSYSGSLCHKSDIVAGSHQHYFIWSSATMQVNAGDSLVCYIYLDPEHLPREIMLQWHDTTDNWDHRAFWGENLIALGTPTYMGAIPTGSGWLRLSVPAECVGLVNKSLSGMAFTLYDGTVAWDAAGVCSSGCGDKPTITSQPQSTTVCAGTPATFSVGAGGTPPLTYQWWENGYPIAGATNSSITIDTTVSSHWSIYWVGVTNACGGLLSANTLLTVDFPPTVTAQPQPVTVWQGGSATFTVVPGGTEPFTYQWKKDGVAIAGASSSSFTTNNVVPASAGSYSVAINNSCGGTSSIAAPLTVIVQAPADQTVGQGSNVTFGVTLTGAGTNSLQWKRNSQPILGATNATLTVTNAQLVDEGIYSVTVNSPGGVEKILLARLSVWSPGGVVTWGLNDYGQTNAPFITNVVSISAGNRHVLALKSDGTLTGWGDNSAGQLTVPAGLTNVVAIAAGGSHNLALKQNGTVFAFGENSAGETNVPVGLSNVVAVAAGYRLSLALRNDGMVVAWGSNSNGLTSGVSGLSNVVGIAAGYYHCLALKSSGTVTGWGYQNPSNGELNIPVGLSNVVGLGVGTINSAAVRSNGTVLVWGNNSFGQTNLPASATNVVALGKGCTASGHLLALRRDLNVVAWGTNDVGQVTMPIGLGDVRAVATGYKFSVALHNFNNSLDRDGDGAIDNEDIDPKNPALRRLSVTILAPPDGATLR